MFSLNCVKSNAWRKKTSILQRLHFSLQIKRFIRVHKIISSPGNNNFLSANENEKEEENNKDKSFARYNEINLQMLPLKIYKQIFTNSNDKQAKLDPKNLSLIKEDLQKFGINIKKTDEIPDVDLIIPSFEGNDIEEHFKNISSSQIKPYVDIIKVLLDNIPPIPEQFVFREGWTRYTESGNEPVEYPAEEGLIFDVEVCMKEGPLPTLATAVSKNAWYGWVSKSLIHGTYNVTKNQYFSPEYLIPLESTEDENGIKLSKHQKKPKILVGHNVAYDRIRIKEQYWINCTGTRFIDTMALHICVSGTSSYQRAVLKSKNLSFEDEKLNSLCSLNTLGDVYKLYCNKTINKASRDVFVEGNLLDIKEKFNELMKYCANDVFATQAVLKNLFNVYCERFPHPASLAGMLELSTSYLPVNYNWTRYVKESETIYDDLNLETKVCLARRADQVCRLIIDDRYKNDPWMWDQDWSTKDIKMKKQPKKAKKVNNVSEVLESNENTEEETEKEKLRNKFKYLNETKDLLPKKKTHMPCYPNWYRKLCYKDGEVNETWLPGAQNISTSMQVTPKLLNLTWENYPLHYIRDLGWGFLIPYSNCNEELRTSFSQVLSQSGRSILLNEKIEKHAGYEKLLANLIKKSDNKCDLEITFVTEDQIFLKLPHKDGVSFNVGNPLSKDFVTKFSDKILAGIDSNATRILEISNMTSYWKNNRDRIMSQIVIWQDHAAQSDTSIKQTRKQMKYGVILPQVLVAGTVTRRAVEPTWMTASKVCKDRIGSELRAMIHCPPNYCFVGADVDSQELWLASIIGDSYYKKIQGTTPFSWMTLIGNKADSTDMHSITAKNIGISRDQAKIINYARIYGAGQKFAERLLKQFNPTMPDKEAAVKSHMMYNMTKGKKFYSLKNNELLQEFEDKLYTQSEAYKIAKLHNKTIDEVFGKGKWHGGMESAMFNSLEEIVGLDKPTTPFLNSRLSRALENELDSKNLPTKVNWVVQSGAVDFLHLILVCMRWLMKDKIRFSLSFHDEVRYLVPIKYKYNAALAMHVTNLLVRSFCVSRLKMNDLPMSVAFFNSVEVDVALRKEADNDCRTPSNPHGLEIGYGIKKGEILNIWDAIKKSNGQVGLLTPANKDQNVKVDSNTPIAKCEYENFNEK